VPGGGGSEEPIQEKLRVYLKSSARPVNIQTITVRIKNIKISKGGERKVAKSTVRDDPLCAIASVLTQ
ncbi:hypothetical protein FCV25MIE_34844, partial [Fagus crenata]